MSKHNDISKAHALLSGTSWNIKGSNGKKTNKQRKDKRKCVHYYKYVNGCRLNGCNVDSCKGSNNCKYYSIY